MYKALGEVLEWERVMDISVAKKYGPFLQGISCIDRAETSKTKQGSVGIIQGMSMELASTKIPSHLMKDWKGF